MRGDRTGFDNPKLVGYFAPEETPLAQRPWIVPEAKEVEKNGEAFALSDGAQFVVSAETKADTYLLDEWIIPEIESRYGIAMKAVTLATADPSRPAIYLGEASDPVFADVFGRALKAVSGENHGPEAYALLVTRDTAQASVAPILEAKDTSSSPYQKPNSAPPARVITAAPGRDRPVTTTYMAK